MDREEFLERYETDGDEGVYAEARQLYRFPWPDPVASVRQLVLSLAQVTA